MDRNALPCACLIVIPCLNESQHIGRLLQDLTAELDEPDWRIVVADGGSSDGTRDIVAKASQADPRITLIDNPRRLQAAAVNLAVNEFGDAFEFFIRMDAHGTFPKGYCRSLIDDAKRTGASSVVVALTTVGFTPVQKAAALAQNSKIGNGGAMHRGNGGGAWVEHGHHALMRVAALRAVGGYDESFTHNEDAELDMRLRKAGFTVWMTGMTHKVYYPRNSIGSLFRQYYNYGKGRARNARKHKTIPRARQLFPIATAPALMLCIFAFLSLATILPASIWVAVCLLFGIYLGLSRRTVLGPLAGLLAIVMHLGWSLGFWTGLLHRNQTASMS